MDAARRELDAELASVYELFPMLAANRHISSGMLSVASSRCSQSPRPDGEAAALAAR